MLSIFPNLLDWWLVAPTLLRAILGLILVRQAYAERTNQPIFTVSKLLFGGLLIIGLLTQAAALASAILIIYQFSRKSGQYQLLILELVVAISLLFLGPGFFAIDLPL